jgi:hypothetical protein
MKRASSDPDIIASEKALRRAAQRAFEIGINSSTPVYVLKDGELVDLTKHKKSGARKSGIDTRMVKLKKLWSDFHDWPQRWAGIPKDIAYGKGILEIYKPFVEELLSRHNLNTVKRHLDNLWLLGGELIRAINMDPEDREKTPMELLLGNIDETGGPYCRHMDSEEQMRSYEATCKKLFKFILERKRLKP